MTSSEHVDLRMPAEWEEHRACWLAWPHNHETWPNCLDDAQAEFIALVNAIAEDEQVRLLLPQQFTDQVKSACGIRREIELLEKATNDAWIRDFGPTMVKSRTTNRIVAIDWNYNCWGQKYPPFDDDQQVAAFIANYLGIDRIQANMIAEGGAIECNGSGDVLTTSSCLLNPNRNPHTTKIAIERQLRKQLGASRIHWCRGIEIQGDDTDGHIDQILRFANESTLLYHQDANARRQLQLACNGIDSAERFELIPIAGPSQSKKSSRVLPASYLNFYVTNRSVLVPMFNDRADEKALSTISSHFPNRKIIGLSSNYLSVGLGSFHCLTQQEPV